jgi:hypothetical protein
MEKDILSKQPDAIFVSRKIFGFWWESISVRIYPMDSAIEVFRETKSHYSRIWGHEKTRLRLIWKPETHDGSGKRQT